MYPKIVYFVKQYGSSGMPDQKAVQEFIDCETVESLNTLRNELIGLSQGNFTEEALTKLIGVKRKVLYNTYQDWAKMMLQWIAGYYRGS